MQTHPWDTICVLLWCTVWILLLIIVLTFSECNCFIAMASGSGDQHLFCCHGECRWWSTPVSLPWWLQVLINTCFVAMMIAGVNQHLFCCHDDCRWWLTPVSLPWWLQVVIDAQWLITIPPDAVKVTSNSGSEVWVCNHYTFRASSSMSAMTDMSGFVRSEFENHVLSLVYIMFLILITTLLALSAHGIITNHRESVFIGIASGFRWGAWYRCCGWRLQNVIRITSPNTNLEFAASSS